MDSNSHRLFGRVLLEKVGGERTLEIWSNAPDIDMNFLHRYERHRFGVIKKTYKEYFMTYAYNSLASPGTIVEQPTAEIAMCIASHLYLDIFNGWIFPFGFWHVVKPNDTILREVLKDLGKPKVLVEELKKLAGDGFSARFYAESETIMRETIPNGFRTTGITFAFIQRLAELATSNIDTQRSLTKEASTQVWKLTGQKPSDMYLDLHSFERRYANLIVRTIEEQEL